MPVPLKLLTHRIREQAHSHMTGAEQASCINPIPVGDVRGYEGSDAVCQSPLKLLTHRIRRNAAQTKCAPAEERASIVGARLPAITFSQTLQTLQAPRQIISQLAQQLLITLSRGRRVSAKPIQLSQFHRQPRT